MTRKTGAETKLFAGAMKGSTLDPETRIRLVELESDGTETVVSEECLALFYIANVDTIQAADRTRIECDLCAAGRSAIGGGASPLYRLEKV